MMKTILRLRNLFKDFSGLEVLCGITLDIFEGERHAIIGPNGAGKSTLFNVISGLYKPSRGEILFLDREISGWPSHKIARAGLSRSFQIINIFPRMTVFENIRNAILSRRNLRFHLRLLAKDREVAGESERVIDLVALQRVRDIPASELSYGEQRKLELALTLALNPLLIMLDEPTAGLNTEDTHNVMHLIRRVTEGKTLVVIEHDMEVVFKLADRITVLNYGRVLASGTPDEIRNNTEVNKAYLQRGQSAASA